MTMLTNYLKVALRNIMRYKVYSSINMLGLGIGMACCILILLWVQDELSYDRFHKNANGLYRVVYEEHIKSQILHDWRTSPPLAAAMKAEFPELIETTRFHEVAGILVKYKNNHFKESFGFTDPSMLRMFTIDFIKGDPGTALKNPYSVIITEEVARKYFGNEEPINKTLRIENQFNLLVTGVINKMPHNSHLKFDLLTGVETLTEFFGKTFLDNWAYNSFITYVLVQANADIDQLSKKISGFQKKNQPESKKRLYLQPLLDIYLYSLEGGGRITNVHLFSLIAFFILFIACINFMNLSTARSSNRTKEIGLRKVVGATRIQLLKQFLGESILLAFISIVVAIILAGLALPIFNEFSEKHLTLDFSNLKFILGLIAITLTVGIMAGIYPAVFLSSFKPVTVLKLKSRSGTGSGTSAVFRKILVVSKFSISIILIICTLITEKQLGYIYGKSLGFDREGKKPNDDVRINVISVYYDFIETFNIKMAQGRSFSRNFSTDASNYILNEEAAKQMGMEEAVGKQFNLFGDKGQIIGVVKNFNFESLFNRLDPLLLAFIPKWYSYLVVKTKPENISNTILFLEKVINRYSPDFPFEYYFLNEDFENLL